jgi:outer membrane receptor protein involved in Fe transport
MNYTHEKFPANTISAPISSAEQDRDSLSPKAGFIWSPSPSSSVRGAYTRSLSGYDLGQSFEIEPTEVAGLLQTFRDPIPIALAGGLDAVAMETAGLVLEKHFADTYLSAGYEYLAAKKTQKAGLYFSDPSLEFDYTASPTFGLIARKFDFLEHAAEFSVHQLIGNGFSLNARYKLAYDELTQSFPEYPASLFLGAPYGIPQRSRTSALLHTVNLSALYRHPSGVFARVEGLFNSQWRDSRIEDMDGTHGGTLPSDQFWQLNLLAGYRFPARRAELAVGLLNATGRNYRLDPLNQYSELPRSRTFYTRLLINF